MNATLRNEARPVLRQHRGVLWCPFCDRNQPARLSTTGR